VTPTIDVVIPTFNGWSHTERCLQHLRAQTVPHRVIVSDNGSSDGTQERVLADFPEATLISGEGNRGFPYACNRGVEAGAGEIVVLLNNDVDVRPDFLERLIAPFADQERVGSVCATLLTSDGRLIDSVGLAADATLAGWPRLRGQPPSDATSEFPRLLGPSGGAGAYRRIAWEEVGGLDEGVRFYSEDVELALRLRAAGWSAAAAPDAIALHIGSATFGVRSVSQREEAGFARAYFIGRYGVLRSRSAARTLATELLVSGADAALNRDVAALRGRVRGLRAARGLPRRPMPDRGVAEPGIDFVGSLRMRWWDIAEPRWRAMRADVPSAVWILDDGLIMGGGQRFGLRLADAFTDLGLPTRFIGPKDSEFGRIATERGFEVVDITYPRLIPPALTKMPAAISRLRLILESASADTLVIGNTARCQAYATAALMTMSRWPVLVHLLHEQTSVTRPSARAVYRRIGALVAVGDQTAELYREHLPGVTVDAISNFMDEAEVRRIVSVRTAPPGGPRPVVGFLGRLIPPKGVLELVDELAAVRDTWEQVRIAAPPQDPAYADRVGARIREHGLQERIILLGGIDDLDAFFASIDVLVVPSVGQHEGQPTVILEALLYERPVIIREQLRSPHLEGLPIGHYGTPKELGELVGDPPRRSVPAEEFLRRFGAQDVVDTLLRVATGRIDPAPPPDAAVAA
jgi:N-acetylglucosaminyl-diphospho-decaprenol L-rhamnosyltransferase